jgi:hypothetical protein
MTMTIENKEIEIVQLKETLFNYKKEFDLKHKE